MVAAYLLAPGHFHDKLQGAGADCVTAPLLPDERIAAVLLDRYDAALTPVFAALVPLVVVGALLVLFIRPVPLATTLAQAPHGVREQPEAAR